MGRSDRRHPLLGAADGGREISNLRHQLHTLGMPCALVQGVAPVYVPLSRGCVLRRWLTCFGAAAARALRVQVQDRERPTMGVRRPASDSEPTDLSSDDWPES